MLRELLKVIAYLSILTSTYSSHLTKDTYTRFRRPLAYTDSISADQQQQHKQQSMATSGEGKGGGGGSGTGGGGSSSSSSSGGSESYSYQLYNPKPPLIKYEPILNELTSKTLHRMSDKVIVNNQKQPSYNKLASNLNSSTNSNHNTTITIPSKTNSRNNNKIKNNYNQNDSNRLKTTNSNYYPQQQQQQQLQQLQQQQQQQQQQQLHPEVTQDGRELEQMFGTAYAKYAMAKIHQMPATTSLNQDQDQLQNGQGVVELKKKRGGGNSGGGGISNGAEEMPEVNDAMVSQMLPRATRRQREYDVPLIRKYKYECVSVFVCVGLVFHSIIVI